MSYFSKNYSNVTYPIDTDENPGLRNAQLGAIYAIGSYFTLNDQRAAILVMPTGSGKTAVLMLAPYLLQKKKILVVTPSAMVRGQITDDFSLLSTLCKMTVFQDTIEKPRVFEMLHKYKLEDNELFEAADVIVATPACALSLSESDWAKQNIDLVEVDEAHHTPAKTWEQILVNLNQATHILFTATPFRLDKKEIKGEIVYNYPLSKAYSDGIFGEIHYIPVPDDQDNKDILIAQKAEEVLQSDRAENLVHYLMVRTDTKANAKYLEQLYIDNTALKLKRIDSSMRGTEIKKCLAELRTGTLDGIICVDMLGEGFDFPNLKIAAIHSPHKSLASTLQFIGRFARTNASNIGSAKFIAANDEELEIENNHLYANDSIWQQMIIDMSEGKNQKEQKDRAYYNTFEGYSELDDDEFPIQALTINCHDRIYRVKDFDINAEFPNECYVANRIFRNPDDNTVVGIGIEFTSPIWMNGAYKINKEYSLYIVHYQKELKMIHIYSPVHTEVLYDAIVECFCSDYEKISKSEMNRVLGEMSNFEIFNSGMVNRFNETGEAYRILAGSDVSNSIDPATGKMFSPGHVFCKAKTTQGGEDVTIGYSSASKVWSSSYLNLHDYISWVDAIGKKIANTSICVKTNTNFDLLPQAESLKRYPRNLFFADFSDSVYASSPVVKVMGNDNNRWRLSDCELRILGVSSDQTKVKIQLQADEEEQIFECDIKGKYSSNEEKFYICKGSELLDLSSYLTDHPLRIKTFDDTIIEGFEIYKGPTNDVLTYDRNQIIGIDWDSYNTDVTVEFVKNGTKTRKGKNSIQDSLREILLENPKNKYILYDHGSGEMADYVVIQEDTNQWIVKLYHVKKKSAAGYNNSMNDVYEVAGQAVKSIIWLSSTGKLIDKIRSRQSSSHCIPIRGDAKTLLKDLRSATKQLVGYVVIVQPGLSRTTKMSDKVQEVLGSASSYISRAGRVRGLEIMGSK